MRFVKLWRFKGPIGFGGRPLFEMNRDDAFPLCRWVGFTVSEKPNNQARMAEPIAWSCRHKSLRAIINHNDNHYDIITTRLLR